MLPASWGSNNYNGGAGSGWNTAANPSAYQNAGNINLQLTNVGNGIETLPTIPFDSVTWELTGDVSGSQTLPSALCQMPTRFSYLPSLGYAVPRIANPNAGAADTPAEVAAQTVGGGEHRSSIRIMRTAADASLSGGTPPGYSHSKCNDRNNITN